VGANFCGFEALGIVACGEYGKTDGLYNLVAGDVEEWFVRFVFVCTEQGIGSHMVQEKVSYLVKANFDRAV